MFKEMSAEYKKELVKYIVLAILSLVLGIYEHSYVNTDGLVFVFLILYLLVGHEIIISGIKGLFRGNGLDENFLMTLASAVAFAIGQYTEAIAVMLFYSFGELFEEIATDKSRRNIEGLLDLVPDVANLVKADGTVVEVDLDDVEVDDILLVRDGEKIGVDGVVVEGTALLDTSSVTGESMPVEVEEGSELISSSIVTSGIIKMRASKKFDDSVAAKIIELIEDSTTSRSESEKLVTRFARVYTPIVVGLAILLAVIPPLFMGGSWNDYIFRAATFLVVSCPCALVLSVPLTFMSGLGKASENGILIKGSQYFEGLKNAQVFLTDKTGTITTGKFKVSDVKFLGDDDKELLLDYIYNMELMSTHPIAQGIVESLDRSKDPGLLTKVQNEKGLGITAETNQGNLLKLGSARFVGHDEKTKERAVYLSIDGKLSAKIFIEDDIKADSESTIANLKDHFPEIAVVSGDSDAAVSETAHSLGLSDYYAEVMPDEKLQIMKTYQDDGKKCIFVGDGINDAPVLTAADVGISMGETSSDLAIESSDILVVSGNFSDINKLLKISDLTNSTVRQNIIFILGIKIAILVLGFLGHANMWLAIFGDVGVTIIAVLYSMRILRAKI